MLIRGTDKAYRDAVEDHDKGDPLGMERACQRRPGSGFKRRPYHRGTNQSRGGLFFAPQDLSGLRSYYRADTEVTVSTGVSDWGDQGPDNLHLTQGTGSLQPALVDPDADFNNQAVVEGDNVDDRMDAGVPSDWTYLHDGNGVTVFFVAAGDNSAQEVLFATNNIQGTLVGLSILLNGTVNVVQVFLTNGTTACINTFVSTYTTGDPFSFMFRYLEGDTPDEWATYLNGVQTAASDTVAAPSASAPARVMNILSRSEISGTFTLEGRLAEIAFYDEAHGQDQATGLHNYAAARYGL